MDDTQSLAHPQQHIWTSTRLDGDGVWYCCRCPHETLLKLSDNPSPHPFQEPLSCERCKHAACTQCTFSNVLRPMQLSTLDATKVLTTTADLLPFGHVCGDCGKSWLAKHCSGRRGGTKRFFFIQFGDQKCTCGAMSSDSWLRFAVGSSKDYREGDPNAGYERSLERKTDPRAADVATALPEPDAVLLVVHGDARKLRRGAIDVRLQRFALADIDQVSPFVHPSALWRHADSQSDEPPRVPPKDLRFQQAGPARAPAAAGYRTIERKPVGSGLHRANTERPRMQRAQSAMQSSREDSGTDEVPLRRRNALRRTKTNTGLNMAEPDRFFRVSPSDY